MKILCKFSYLEVYIFSGQDKALLIAYILFSSDGYLRESPEIWRLTHIDCSK